MRVLLAAVLVLAASTGGCSTQRLSSGNGSQPHPLTGADLFTRLREQMVREQLETRGIRDAKVLAAMRKVPRHRFVPPELTGEAYTDGPLPIGSSQTISQPYIVAYMTQVLALGGSERVLEIGTGSGYQAAVLAEIIPEVFTIEIVPELASRAKSILDQLGYRNIRFRAGDGYQGWPEHAPFGAIIVTAAPDHVPQPLVDQLAAGGRMVIPVGGGGEQDLLLVEKTHAGVTRRSTIPVRFVPMTGKAKERPPRR